MGGLSFPCKPRSGIARRKAHKISLAHTTAGTLTCALNIIKTIAINFIIKFNKH